MKQVVVQKPLFARQLASEPAQSSEQQRHHLSRPTLPKSTVQFCAHENVTELLGIGVAGLGVVTDAGAGVGTGVGLGVVVDAGAAVGNWRSQSWHISVAALHATLLHRPPGRVPLAHTLVGVLIHVSRQPARAPPSPQPPSQSYRQHSRHAADGGDSWPKSHVSHL